MGFEVNHIFIRIVSMFTLAYIIRLIYAHNLRIGSSWFLLILGTGFFVLSIWPDSIEILSIFTGTNSWASNILFFFIIFLFIIVVHCTIMISGLINCVKELGQELTLLMSDMDEEKIKNEAGAAHAIKTATVHPLIINDLKNLALIPSKAKKRKTLQIQKKAQKTNSSSLVGKNIEKSRRTADMIFLDPDGND